MSYADIDYFAKTMFSHNTKNGRPITGINVFYMSGICTVEKVGYETWSVVCARAHAQRFNQYW